MIRLEHVEKTYPGRRGAPQGEPTRALRDVCLRIPRGGYAAIIGPSGSGKSTLMHILGCLDTPSAGEYWLDGRQVSELDARGLCAIRRERIGFVFQGCQLLGKLTALENVAFPLLLRGVEEQRRLRMAREALASVGLSDRLHYRPGELSGGQRQRVAIARALSYRPKLLLADEPTGALDTESRDGILALFSALHRDGHTIVLITHDPSVARHALTRWRVEDGRVYPTADARIPCGS